MNKVMITGGAGFLGTNMVRLINQRFPDWKVVIFDNFSTGKAANMQQFGNNTYLAKDLLDDPIDLMKAMEDCDVVFHFAANADIRHGIDHRLKDIEQNIMATQSVLEAMMATITPTIVFTSTAPVYGENPIIPTPEDAPMTYQTSLYATSKLAAEGLITSYCQFAPIKALIFRPVSMLGPYYSHGHVIDFYRQLRENPRTLTVLGNGKAVKSYIHVQDACEAMLHCLWRVKDEVNIFNLALPATITVLESANLIADSIGGHCKDIVLMGDSSRGWVGDVPHVELDVTKLLATGFQPKFNLREAIIDTVKWLKEQDAAKAPEVSGNTTVPPAAPTRPSENPPSSHAPGPVPDSLSDGSDCAEGKDHLPPAH